MSTLRWALRALALGLLAACSTAPKAGPAELAAILAGLDPSVPDVGAAVTACRRAGASGRAEAVEPLLKLWDALLERKFRRFELAPELEAVRAEAAGALGLLGDIKAVPVLRRGLLDDDKAVAARSAEALAALRDGGSVPALARLAEGPDDALARSALEALGALGGAAAEEALRKALDGPRPLHAVTAAYGLGRQGQVGGRLRLEGWLEETVETTPEGLLAAEYLARLGERSGVDFLARLAIEGSPEHQAAARAALGRVPGKAAAAALKGLEGKR